MRCGLKERPRLQDHQRKNKATRPGPAQAVDHLRNGVTRVVWKLD